MVILYYLGITRFRITPTNAAKPMPPIVMLPMVISALPMPVVRIREAIGEFNLQMQSNSNLLVLN